MTATLTDQLALCDTLRAAAFTANALDGKHAHEGGGTYGAIKQAAIKAIAVTLETEEGFAAHKATVAALWVWDECVDNGESVTFNYNIVIGGL